MQILNHLLSINVFSPAIGIFFILLFYFFGNYNKECARLSNCFGRIWPIFTGIIAASIPFFISLCYFFENISAKLHLPFSEKFMLIKFMNIEYSLGVDGPAILMMLFSSFISVICLIIFWQNKNYSSRHTILGVIMLLILEICCLGVFAAKDLIIFYIFFEASLIPMIFIIGIWGGENRVYAALKLFLYTIFGSLFFLFAIVYLKMFFGTTDPDLLKTMIVGLPLIWKKIIWICLFVAFAIKIPMIPFHTWLPDAHVQAPTFGSVILAGVLIKMGTYAMMRFLIPMMPDITNLYSGFLCGLSVVAIIYGSLICIAQKNLKKLIAYSSVAHMGYVTLGLFAPCGLGYAGAVFQMISHGFISAALFYSVGIIYDKLGSLEISKIQFLATKMPFFGIMFMIFTLGSIGLPGTSGFVGEFLVILNAISKSGYLIYGMLAGLGVIFGAVYMLILYKNIFLRHDESTLTIGNNINLNTSLKTSRSQNLVLLTFAFLIIYYGLQPSHLLKKIENVKMNEYFNCDDNKNSKTKSG